MVANINGIIPMRKPDTWRVIFGLSSHNRTPLLWTRWLWKTVATFLLKLYHFKQNNADPWLTVYSIVFLYIHITCSHYAENILDFFDSRNQDGGDQTNTLGNRGSWQSRTCLVFLLEVKYIAILFNYWCLTWTGSARLVSSTTTLDRRSFVLAHVLLGSPNGHFSVMSWKKCA